MGKKDEAIINAIIVLAKNLELNVTAEGVGELLKVTIINVILYLHSCGSCPAHSTYIARE